MEKVVGEGVGWEREGGGREGGGRDRQTEAGSVQWELVG